MSSRTVRSVLAFALVCGSLSALAPRPAAAAAPSSNEQRIAKGFAIAPVPLHFRPRDKQWVGLGSYLVNAVGGCNDCHTNPPYAAGHDPYKGEPMQFNAEAYLAGGQQFGPFTSRNLTPDENGLPAGMSFPMFRETLRTGHDHMQQHPEISPLLQVMPWPVYGQMTDDDLRAIYIYLTAIPSIQH